MFQQILDLFVPIVPGVDLSALLIAVVGAVFTFVVWLAGHQSRRQEAERLRQAAAALHLEVLREWERDVRPWAEACVAAIQEGLGLTYMDPAQAGNYYVRSHALVQRVQYLIDTGRWLYPNIDDAHGASKYPGFQGLAHVTRDILKEGVKHIIALDKPAINGVVQTLADKRSLGPQLLDVKQRFVSEIHKAINPAKRNKLVEHFQ